MRLHKRFFVPFEIFLISLDLIRYQKIKITQGDVDNER